MFGNSLAASIYHNHNFIKQLTKEFPEQVDVKRLLNVSYNPDSYEIKFYCIDDDLKCLNKYTKDVVVKQYMPHKNKQMLEKYERMTADFLEYKPDFNTIIIDMVENNTVYISTRLASLDESKKFYDTVFKKLHIDKKDFFKALSYINNASITDYESADKLKAIALIKIPLATGHLKVYARPFNHGNNFALNAKSMKFFENLLSCKPLTKKCMQYCFITYEFDTQKCLIITQNEYLRRKLFKF